MYKIPKVIHYIWLGNNELDKVSKKCMKTWTECLPDYKVQKWGDKECLEIINNNTYCKEAYENKKYAFVSDYLRLYVLYNFGGIYMDTDVEVYKSLDRFLNDSAFTCFESKDKIPTALFAAEKGNEWVKMLLDYYNDRHFILENGEFDLKTNVESITELSYDWGFIPNGEEQVLKSGAHIYTKDYFCPLDTLNSKNNVFTKNTYAAHLYNGSWRTPLRRRLSKIKKKLGINLDKIFGKKLHNWMKKRVK